MGETLKERQRREAEREERIRAALVARSKPLELARRERRHKKKTADELAGIVAVGDILGHAIRPLNAYVPRSYNLDKQVLGLLDHLFVRYRPVPRFLYQACLPPARDGDRANFAYMNDLYRRWFLALAQGGSFPKLVKGFMTAREAFVFLGAPVENLIHENVWWAKLKVAGIPAPMAEKLIGRVFTNHFFDDPDGRLAEVVTFYARFHPQMDRVAFGEITDFVAWTLRNERDFRFRGRTITSMTALSNAWHALMQKAKLGRHVEWAGFGVPAWVVEEKDEVWEVTELLTNRELAEEGRRQKHCVYSYVHWCMEGRCSIFSLRACRRLFSHYDGDGLVVWQRGEELCRVTVEVDRGRRIVQARGPLNRPPAGEEIQMLRRWAGEKGFTSARCY